MIACEAFVNVVQPSWRNQCSIVSAIKYAKSTVSPTWGIGSSKTSTIQQMLHFKFLFKLKNPGCQTVQNHYATEHSFLLLNFSIGFSHLFREYRFACLGYRLFEDLNDLSSKSYRNFPGLVEPLRLTTITISLKEILPPSIYLQREP